MIKHVYAIVLAAGLSTRMGRPKQLLPFGDKTILQTVVDTLIATDSEGVLVVLGHEAEAVRESLGGRSVLFCLNDRYQEGMFSSVLCGIAHLPPRADAALIVLCDQPQMEVRVVQAVIRAYQANDKGIVIPTVEGQRGHPALVDLRRYREAIFALSGEMGLKPVMRGYPEDTLEVPIADDRILRDLDTPEQYEAELDRLRKEKE
ncbi:MAG: nucleotidyltransferase family protein [bacterium]|nr:nucleotidyltransferase family protein [bacterium]